MYRVWVCKITKLSCKKARWHFSKITSFFPLLKRSFIIVKFMNTNFYYRPSIDGLIWTSSFCKISNWIVVTLIFKFKIIRLGGWESRLCHSRSLKRTSIHETSIYHQLCNSKCRVWGSWIFHIWEIRKKLRFSSDYNLTYVQFQQPCYSH